MITLRPAAERGRTRLDWLDSRHGFSFNDYRDPRHESFRTLRVLNEDWVAPGQGFGTHGHRDMEILTYLVSGALEHRDSLGSGAVLHPGEVQVMTAGTGIRHSEFNPSAEETVHLLQVWLLPDRAGRTPRYDQRLFPAADRRGVWRRIAGPAGREGSGEPGRPGILTDGALPLHQDAGVFATLLDPGQRLEFPLRPGRAAWVQVVRGPLRLGDQTLAAGDGAAVEEEARLVVEALAPAEALLFDLA